ncbi:MAG: HDOD domain-containing protein [Pseudomonadota bacterium]
MTESTEAPDTAIRLAQTIASLPPLPATAQEILTCFGDEFIDADKVTAIIEDDPGICGRLLGLANSAYFGLAEPTTAVSEAISRVLGVDTVRSLVLAMAIQQSFSFRSCPSFDVERFWTQSLLTAEISKRIALSNDLDDEKDRDLAYSCGLCHNLGLLALAHSESEGLNRALQLCRGVHEPDALSVALHNEFDVDHRIVTAELAKAWSLPDSMAAAYELRAFPELRSGNNLGLVLAVAVAIVNFAQYETGEDRVREAASQLDCDVDAMVAFINDNEREKQRIQTVASRMSR